MKNFLKVFALFLILSCDDVINQPESNKYGAIKLTFNKPSEELTENINNNRSMSQFADVDAVRITINNSSPVTVSIVGGSASYSKSGLSVGTATIKVELTGAGITKYTQTKSVTIVADQTASTSFNAFAITNQSLSFASSFQSTYDGGDIINLSWTNSHAEQPVNIERWDQVGGIWVKTKTVEDDFIGTSFSWNTQGEASGENVKIRIQSTISNSFIDSQSFQLLSSEFVRYLTSSDGVLIFNDIIQSNGDYLIGGYLSNNEANEAQPLFLKLSGDGNTIWSFVNSSTINNQSTRGYEELAHGGDNLPNLAFGIYLDKNWGGASNRLVIDTINHVSQTVPYETIFTSSGSDINIGSAAVYTKNNSNFLAIGVSYLHSTYGWNAGTLFFEISSTGDLTYLNHWGWHSEPGDQFTLDIKTNGQDKIIQSVLYVDASFSSPAGSLVYFRRNDFDPSSGTNSFDYFYPHSNYTGNTSVNVAYIAHREFNSEFKAEAFTATSTDFYQYNLTTAYFENPTIGFNLLSLDSDISNVTNGLITANDNYVFTGRGYIDTSQADSEPTILIYDSSLSLTQKITLNDFNRFSGVFYDIIENDNNELVAVGFGQDVDNTEYYGLFYISGGSSNRSNLNNSNIELNYISPSQSISFSGKEVEEVSID